MSAFLDFFIFALAHLIVSIILEEFGLVHPGYSSPIANIVFFILIILFINKDYFRSKSIGKRIFGQIIINKSDSKPATSLKCMLRNLTIFIFPVEAIILVFWNKERIGDSIAGTKVVASDKEPWSTIIDEIKETLKKFKNYKSNL